MKAKNFPKTKELKLDHLIEEASEVIKACIKIKRFGAGGRELKSLASEIADVNLAYQRYLNHPL